MGFILPKFNSKRRKVRDKTASLICITAMATALTLLPLPMKISAVEEREKSGQETEAAPETSPQESEPLRESEQETAGREEKESASGADSRGETEPVKESEQETAAKEETQLSTTAPTESEPLKQTEQETSAKEEIEKREETETKEPPVTTAASRETEPLKETEPSKKTDSPKEAEPSKETEEEPEEGEEEEKPPREAASEIKSIIRSEVPEAAEIKVPIYNYDVVNIVAPAKYAVALNPYELAVRTGEEDVSTEQVVSRNYGILNKSSTDKIVRVTFVVEDLNGGEIAFVDSAEEAWEADEDTYAVYLAAVPADDSGIWVDGEPVDCDTTAAELSDVEMEKALDSALPLGEGENTLSFKLSKAVYNFEDGRELSLDEEDGEHQGSLKLLSLAPGEGGITAFTFIGAMNRRGDWGKLLYGIKISAIYTYETATGEEKIIEGTGAMIREY